MNNHGEHPDACGGRCGLTRLLLEAVTVAAVGAALALAANAVSPRGLKLATNYFPTATPVPGTSNTPPANVVRTNPPSAFEALAARLKAQNLRMVVSNEVATLYADPRYRQESVVFIDARKDADYQAGHIPGAYPFDHYYPEKQIATVLPVCMAAEEIVVYCNGGDCEDSEFAAVTLRGAGIAGEKFAVYAGGFSDWTTNGWPVEVGGRHSGDIRTPGVQPVKPGGTP